MRTTLCTYYLPEVIICTKGARNRRIGKYKTPDGRLFLLKATDQRSTIIVGVQGRGIGEKYGSNY